MEEKILVKWGWGFRGGVVEGLFVTTQSELNKAFGQEVYFGEILGKHSEVEGVLEEHEFEIISTDKAFVEQFQSIVGYFGYNPLDYISEEDEEDEE